MDDKELPKNQVSPVTPTLRTAGRPATDGSYKPGHGGQRRGSGRPKGSQNKATALFKDVLLQAVSEVGSSREEGVDGPGGLLGYLKMAAIREEKTTLLLLGRILPLKITTEVKEDKETMTIEEAVADLRACGMDELLAFYLKRYPLERDDEDRAWAEGINIDLVRDPPIDVMPESDMTPPKEPTALATAMMDDTQMTLTEQQSSDMEKTDMLALAESIERAAAVLVGDSGPPGRVSEIGKQWIVDGLRLLADTK